ncbi:MAG TPA: sialidase family protein [Chitinophagaceae bacterium]|jgi:alpha-L-fucosidase|nr:sialidase family protein [Chitinophagaceae bacterium]
MSKPFLFCFLLWLVPAHPSFGQVTWRKVREELIVAQPAFAQCHASTILEISPERRLAAFFAGPHEGHQDVGIWLAVEQEGTWLPPVVVATGESGDSLRYPCWNPVLFRSRAGTVFLFYKVGPNPRKWWGLVRMSRDEGRTWSAPVRLPDGILGPVKNKPVQLADGTILSPSSTETETKWSVHVERSADGGVTWQRIPVHPESPVQVIQPSILHYGARRLQLLCRSRHDRLMEAWSEDGGKTWGPLTATSVMNPNAGTDAVTLQNGRQLLVYNPALSGREWYNGRSRLHVAMSGDGIYWNDVAVLENGDGEEYSYPAVIEGSDGRVHITYTYNRKNIKYVVLEP